MNLVSWNKFIWRKIMGIVLHIRKFSKPCAMGINSAELGIFQSFSDNLKKYWESRQQGRKRSVKRIKIQWLTIVLLALKSCLQLQESCPSLHYDFWRATVLKAKNTASLEIESNAQVWWHRDRDLTHRGVTRGQGGTIPQAHKHWGRRKVPTMSPVLSSIQYICSQKS